MQPIAVEKAQDCLSRAKEALQVLEDVEGRFWTEDLQRGVDAWQDLLIWGNRIFTKLEAGAKGTASQPWFGTLRHDQREDPLLAYMKNARDADEHGLAKVVEIQQGNLSFSVPEGKPTALKLGVSEDGDITAEPAYPWVKATGGKKTTVKLAQVHNRGRSYPVPAEHKGAPIGDATPLALAATFVAYLTQAVAEAKARSEG